MSLKKVALVKVIYVQVMMEHTVELVLIIKIQEIHMNRDGWNPVMSVFIRHVRLQIAVMDLWVFSIDIWQILNLLIGKMRHPLTKNSEKLLLI